VRGFTIIQAGGQRLWQQMEAYPKGLLSNNYSFIADDIQGLISRNHTWHRDNNIGPSPYYPQPLLRNLQVKQ